MKAGEKKAVAIVGSTGSIGRSTLDVIRANPARFRVVALAAGRNTGLLKRQIREFSPAFVSVLTEDAAKDIVRHFPYLRRAVGFGTDGACRAAAHREADITVSAIVGAAGFLPTLAAIKAGHDVALANKETLVMGGALVMREARKMGVRMLPVDSEHSAVFQALRGHRLRDVKRIILTASGGPFLRMPLKGIREATPAEALAHPTWSMGRRITVDSATLMNKAFEVIEARWLFGVTPDKITVCVHPQSVVHSMVEYIDGSIVAQMGSPDMKGPIAYALAYPERINAQVKPFDITGKTLTFLKPDPRRFPCLGLAYSAMEQGETAACVLNAADEVCVEEFLKGTIGFTDIYGTVASVLEGHRPWKVKTVDDILEADRWAREAAKNFIMKGKGRGGRNI